jgi:hypothetical protein
MLGCEGKIEIRQKNVARSKQGACSKQTRRLLEASERGTGRGDSFSSNNMALSSNNPAFSFKKARLLK